MAITDAFALRQWMKQRDARKTVSDLHSVVMMYHTEYKRFPNSSILTSGADSLLTTSSSDGLMNALCPDIPILAPHQSRREVSYFSTSGARTDAGPGIWRNRGEIHVRDPWGNFYAVHLDTNYDGKLEISYPDGTVHTLPRTVAVRSLGQNGVIDHTPGFRNDDVMAY